MDDACSEEMKALDEAIKIADGVGALAARIGVAQSLVSMWKKRGSIPAEYCPAIERETGVTCERLCKGPDWTYLRAAAAAPQAVKSSAKKPPAEHSTANGKTSKRKRRDGPTKPATDKPTHRKGR